MNAPLVANAKRACRPSAASDVRAGPNTSGAARASSIATLTPHAIAVVWKGSCSWPVTVGGIS